MLMMPSNIRKLSLITLKDLEERLREIGNPDLSDRFANFILHMEQVRTKLRDEQKSVDGQPEALDAAFSDFHRLQSGIYAKSRSLSTGSDDVPAGTYFPHASERCIATAIGNISGSSNGSRRYDSASISSSESVQSEGFGVNPIAAVGGKLLSLKNALAKKLSLGSSEVRPEIVGLSSDQKQINIPATLFDCEESKNPSEEFQGKDSLQYFCIDSQYVESSTSNTTNSSIAVNTETDTFET